MNINGKPENIQSIYCLMKIYFLPLQCNYHRLGIKNNQP